MADASEPTHPDPADRNPLAEDCRRCPALVDCRTRISWGVGPRDASLVVVGEAPGAGDPDRETWRGGNHSGMAYTAANSGRKVRALVAEAGYEGDAYYTNAYKEPREINWILGIVLISLVLFFGYTGYLLPWDQLAFWAGQIGVELFLSVPLIGEWLAQLLFGGFSLSQSTLQRMYIMHVFLLPFVTTTLVAIHIGIVWMQGIAEPH